MNRHRICTWKLSLVISPTIDIQVKHRFTRALVSLWLFRLSALGQLICYEWIKLVTCARISSDYTLYSTTHIFLKTRSPNLVNYQYTGKIPIHTCTRISSTIQTICSWPAYTLRVYKTRFMRSYLFRLYTLFNNYTHTHTYTHIDASLRIMHVGLQVLAVDNSRISMGNSREEVQLPRTA